MKTEEILQHCQYLKANPSVLWFIEENVTIPMTECDDVLRNLKVTAEEREAALHKWNALNEISKFLPEKEKFALNKQAQAERFGSK